MKRLLCFLLVVVAGAGRAAVYETSQVPPPPSEGAINVNHMASGWAVWGIGANIQRGENCRFRIYYSATPEDTPGIYGDATSPQFELYTTRENCPPGQVRIGCRGYRFGYGEQIISEGEPLYFEVLVEKGETAKTISINSAQGAQYVTFQTAATGPSEGMQWNVDQNGTWHPVRIDADFALTLTLTVVVVNHTGGSMTGNADIGGSPQTFSVEPSSVFNQTFEFTPEPTETTWPVSADATGNAGDALFHFSPGQVASVTVTSFVASCVYGTPGHEYLFVNQIAENVTVEGEALGQSITFQIGPRASRLINAGGGGVFTAYVMQPDGYPYGVDVIAFNAAPPPGKSASAWTCYKISTDGLNSADPVIAWNREGTNNRPTVVQMVSNANGTVTPHIGTPDGSPADVAPSDGAGIASTVEFAVRRAVGVGSTEDGGTGAAEGLLGDATNHIRSSTAKTVGDSMDGVGGQLGVFRDVKLVGLRPQAFFSSMLSVKRENLPTTWDASYTYAGKTISWTLDLGQAWIFYFRILQLAFVIWGFVTGMLTFVAKV